MRTRIHHHVHCSLALRIPHRSRFLAKHYRSSATLSRSSRTTTSSEFERLAIASVESETEASSSRRYALTRGQSWLQRSRFPPTFLVADSVHVPFDTQFRAPRPKSLHPKSGRARFVCHPNRKHLVPSPHPDLHSRCSLSPADRSLLTKACRDSPANRLLSKNTHPIDVFSTAFIPKDASPRHPKVLGRLTLRSSPFPASRSVLCPHDACARSSVAARRLLRPFGLRRRGGHRRTFVRRGFPRYRSISFHRFVRVRGFPGCRSISFRRVRHGVGCNAALHAHGANDTPNSLAVEPAVSLPESAVTVEPSTAGVRGHLPWGPRPSDEMSQGDRCVGLPHRHHPLSGFLTLSAV